MMRVTVKPISGTDIASIEQVREELVRVLGFRGEVLGAEANGSNIEVRFEINRQWGLPTQQKVQYLKEWIPAKTRISFTVLGVSEETQG